MKVQVKDEQGREVNPYDKYTFGSGALSQAWAYFEKDVKKYEAPGIEDGTHECELKDKDDWGVKKGNDYYSYDTRQIWVLAEQEKETIPNSTKLLELCKASFDGYVAEEKRNGYSVGELDYSTFQTGFMAGYFERPSTRKR